MKVPTTVTQKKSSHKVALLSGSIIIVATTVGLVPKCTLGNYNTIIIKKWHDNL